MSSWRVVFWLSWGIALLAVAHEGRAIATVVMMILTLVFVAQEMAAANRRAGGEDD